MQLLAYVLGLGLGLGFFIKPFIVRHMAAQQLLDLVANATVGPCFRVRVFIIPFIVRHMAAQQLLDLVANANVGPCFRVRVRVRVFHQTVYSAPHGSTTIVRFSYKCNFWPMF
jgi:hypothetical protein